MVPVEFKVDLSEYKSGTECWLTVYGQSILESNTLQERGKTGQALRLIGLPITRNATVKADEYFWVFVFVKRYLCNGDEQSDDKTECAPFSTRAGFASVTVDELDRGAIVTLTDIQGQSVGTLSAQIVPTKDTRYHVKIIEDDAPTLRYSPTSKPFGTDFDPGKQLRDFAETNIHSSLPVIRSLTVSQHCGTIPMWAFPLLNLTHKVPTASYFDQAAANAHYMLSPSAKERGAAWEGELLNEAQTLATRAQLYVVDTSKRRGQNVCIDDWLNPLIAPVPRLLGLDCEDAAMRLVQESWWWKHAPSRNARKEAQDLMRIEQDYVTFFVAMTLRVADAFKNQSSHAPWVYHAAALKLDKRYVLRKLGLSTTQEHKQLRPGILLEGTAATTGCWAYDSDRDEVSFNSQAKFSMGDTVSKVTSRMMRNKNLYGHIVSMFSPELALEHGIVQIDLSDGGKRGAMAKFVMRYEEGGVEWHPIQFDARRVKERIGQVNRLAYAEPRLPQVTKLVEHKVMTTAPEIDFVLRDVDWNSATQKELEANFKRPLQSVRVQVANDLHLWRVWG